MPDRIGSPSNSACTGEQLLGKGIHDRCCTKRRRKRMVVYSSEPVESIVDLSGGRDDPGDEVMAKGGGLDELRHDATDVLDLPRSTTSWGPRRRSAKLRSNSRCHNVPRGTTQSKPSHDVLHDRRGR